MIRYSHVIIVSDIFDFYAPSILSAIPPDADVRCRSTARGSLRLKLITWSQLKRMITMSSQKKILTFNPVAAGAITPTRLTAMHKVRALIKSPWLIQPSVQFFFSGLPLSSECPHISLVLGTIADMNRSICSVKVERIKRQSRLKNPLHNFVAR